MKKSLKILLAVMLVTIMAISFASCTLVMSVTPEKAKEKLEELGYEVYCEEGKEAIEYYWQEVCLTAEEGGVDFDAKTPITIMEIYQDESHVLIFWFKNDSEASNATEDLESCFFIHKQQNDTYKNIDFIGVFKGKIVVFGYGDAFADACDVVGIKL